tara:strand:+ start:1561 stop:1812 length:252 start_codon:yes stop_codon:yes gene_type:complete
VIYTHEADDAPLFTVDEVWDAWQEVQESIVNAGMDMSDFSKKDFPRMIEDYLTGEWEEVECPNCGYQTTLEDFGMVLVSDEEE